MTDDTKEESLKIGGETFHSRLFLGSGKFASNEHMVKAVLSSKTELVTMTLRRIDFKTGQDGFLDAIKKTNAKFLPNTSGARTATEAIRISKICAAAIGKKWVKLEVTPDPKSLLPDPIETLKAAQALVKEGFEVYPYINADPILSHHLEDCGCVCVMPLGAPIGTNLGMTTKEQIKIIIEQSNIPVVVDAGLGKPSHSAEAMELGADAVLVNTAIATSKNSELAAEAFNLATIAGRKAYLSGLPEQKTRASASSPIKGFLREIKTI